MRNKSAERSIGSPSTPKAAATDPRRLITGKTRILVIAGALLALFLGALDALVVGAAMPTIVADLGGLHLYSWVFSSYMLARAITLPVFGKLCDLYSSKKLYIFSICLFVASSVLGGAARSMHELICCRALQGVGAGGTFALAYIVVSDLSPPEKRGKMMGLISFVWGVASILGPATGGFVVTWLSWRWIFYMNAPLGFAALLMIALFLKEVREKKQDASIDFAGIITLSVSVLAILTAFMLGGRSYPWISPEIGGLFLVSFIGAFGFYHAERRAKEPLLELEFFRNQEFTCANGSAFFSSFAIFSLSAFSPLFIQGALGKTPAELGLAMIPLTLAWSSGAMLCGQIVTRGREKALNVWGSCLLVGGAALTLTLSSASSLLSCTAALAVAGLGMGFVSVSTLLTVQNSLDASNLGVATSSQQFARTLGGTVGIGISGSFVTLHFTRTLEALMNSSLKGEIPASLSRQLAQGVEALFQPDTLSALSPVVQKTFQQAAGNGVQTVFWSALITSIISLLFCFLLPSPRKIPRALPK